MIRSLWLEKLRDNFILLIKTTCEKKENSSVISFYVTYEVRMVMGEDFSDKMFQNPGGYFPGRVIREPQL